MENKFAHKTSLMVLHNTLGKEALQRRLEAEEFQRRTLSFYRYMKIDEPEVFRDTLYREWAEMACLGRVYLALEGINAQMSVPVPLYDEFVAKLRSHKPLEGILLNDALEGEKNSFLKLTVRVRSRIVADGLDDETFSNTGTATHLGALEFHELAAKTGTCVVDMRNHYESEVGHFRNALCPDADTFREELEMVREMLSESRDKKILLYCTGGIRCEKAGAWLKYHGFTDVNQLKGGILEYVRVIREEGLDSQFIGKNFVFDSRLGERVTPDVLGRCHQCGMPCDHHTNCANDDCHLLFIQCDACRQEYEGCCSVECREMIRLPEQDRRAFRDFYRHKYGASQIFRSKLRPDVSRGMKEDLSILVSPPARTGSEGEVIPVND